jgi:5-methyltetrahydrofolate--homocysteine methyltransferase
MTDHINHRQIYDAILEGDPQQAEKAITVCLQAGEAPLDLINQVLNPAISEVGSKFDLGEYYLPELIMAAEAMEAAVEVMKPYLEARKELLSSSGRVVMATVQGDVHDIGKNIVCALLRANGFNVLDLGRDVPALEIVQKAEEFHADIIGLSALLSTTLPYSRDTLKLLEEKGLRQKYHVFIGGGATTAEFAEKIGAEYGGTHAEAAVRQMLKAMGRE